MVVVVEFRRVPGSIRGLLWFFSYFDDCSGSGICCGQYYSCFCSFTVENNYFLILCHTVKGVGGYPICGRWRDYSINAYVHDFPGGYRVGFFGRF